MLAKLVEIWLIWLRVKVLLMSIMTMLLLLLIFSINFVLPQLGFDLIGVRLPFKPLDELMNNN